MYRISQHQLDQNDRQLAYSSCIQKQII